MVENNPMKIILRKIYTDILQLLNLLSEGANFILFFLPNEGAKFADFEISYSW